MEKTIQATPVAPDAYNAFLREVLSPDLMLRGELLVYQYMERLCETYKGGSWVINRLDNGGWYMAPKRDEPMHLQWTDNMFDGVMSSDAAGIVATLFAINNIATTYEIEELGPAYNKLLVFANEHAEAGLIGGAID